MNATPQIFGKRPLDSDSGAANLRLRIGEHVVDLGALRVVTNPGAPRLTSKAAAVLIELARHAGDTVTRDQLLDRVWKDRVTTPDVLTQAIKELRRAFADDARPARYIETIPKLGYRLLAAVSEVDAPALRLASESDARPPANDDHAIEAEAATRGATPRQRPRRALWYATGIAIALLVAGAVLALSMRRPSPEAASAPRWRAVDVRAITSDPGPERRPRISPDGTRVVYTQLDPATGFERLLVRGVDQSSAVHITPRAFAHEEGPVWSPDGTRIAFERLVDKTEACTMYIVPSMGGAETEVGPCGNFLLNYYDWAPDGKSLITVEQKAEAAGAGLPLALLDLSTGQKKVLDYARVASDQDLDPHYSPDGNSIAFRRGMPPHSELFVMSANGGATRQLTHLDARIAGHAWTPDGSALVFAANLDGALALYTVGIGGGAPEPLGVRPAAFPDVARHGGTVVYEVPRTKTQLAVVTKDAHADPQTLLAPQLLARSTGSDWAPAFSPDGRQIAFVSDRNGSQQIWLDAPGDNAEPFALTDFRGAIVSHPQWRGDGKQLLATVRMGGISNLVQIDVATRRHQVVAASQSAVISGGYGPDADSYLLIRRTPQAHSELIVLQHADRAGETVLPLAAAAAHAELDRAAGMVYYTKYDDLGVFRRPLAGGAESLVTRSVTSTTMDGWRVVDGRVWYVTGMMLKPFDLREVDPETGADRPLLRVNQWLRDTNFGVGPNRERVLFAPMGTEDVDVGAFSLAGSAPH